MIGIIDPALLLLRPSNEVEAELALILQICRTHSIQVIPLPEYWPTLWSTLGRALEATLTPNAKRSVQALRQLGNLSTISIPPAVGPIGSFWTNGFSELFGAAALGVSWETQMANSVLRVLAAGHDVIILTRRMLGRNMKRHSAGNCTLDENTRWILHVQPPGFGHRQILCVHHSRNLIERWTVRFDWRLPSDDGVADFPFRPNAPWWKAATLAHRTVSSKPAWIDDRENGWARPNINDGSGYHWDVFITRHQLQKSVGLTQVNVAAYGGPPAEGAPGTIHHAPGIKAPKLTGKGWK